MDKVMNQIKEITLSTGKWLFVTVKEGTEPHLKDGFLYQSPLSVRIPLPAGHTYTLIGKASDLPWYEWTSIIESEHDGSDSLRRWYKNYANGHCELRNVAESGLSLLKAHGLSPDTCIIIKQED